MRIVIIGGGLIGLACAWRLQRPGVQVTVLDGAPAAREASWAAAGMLAPHHEAAPDWTGRRLDLWRLGTASLAAWPEFAARLGGAEAVDFRQRGGLVPVLDDADGAEVDARLEWLAAHGIAGERLTPAQLQSQEPGIAARWAARLPAAQANPRLVAQALGAAIARAGGVVRYRQGASGLRSGGVVLTDGTELACDLTILAAGAWTPDLAGLAGLDLPGAPVKGQMLRLAAPDGLLDSFVHCHHAYLVPRRGEGIVVGSTMVWDGFAKAEDPDAIARLAANARRVLPALADCPVAETWTGLRPQLNGGLPVIARIRPDLLVATGHFRNGVLLTPITAAAIAHLALGDPLTEDLTSFAPPVG